MPSLTLCTTPQRWGNYYQWLGKLVAATMPHIEEQILSDVKNITPFESDIEKVGDYFLIFCKHQNIDPLLYHSYQKNEKTNVRRLFIGCMMLLYRPQLTHSAKHKHFYKDGLIGEIATVLQMAYPNVSRRLDDVAVWYKNNYENFKDKVDVIVEQLKEERK